MIELMLAIALLGTLIAGLWDFFTTEIPDEIPAIMAALGIFGWFVFMLSNGNYLLFLASVAVGTIYLVVGWTLYSFGQWGGGDAALMASVGYLVPLLPNTLLFPMVYLVNVFFVGAIWVVVYAIAIGFMKPRIFNIFFNDLKKTWKNLFGLLFCFLLILFFLSSLDIVFAYILMLLAIILFLVIFYKYASIVEKIVFKKRVPTSQLKVGDVLADSKLWVGLTEKQIMEIRRKRKVVIIKEGVRFGPTFFLALVLTALYGNILFLFLAP